MIRDCLESVRFADEIIVVDSGSTDSTLAICAEYTDRIYHQDWLGMNGQKAFALEKSRGDWILNIDADERITPELAAEILDVITRTNGPVVGYFLPRKAYYLGKWFEYGGWMPDYKLRLFRKGHGSWQGTDPHDLVVVNGPCARLNSHLLHYSFRDLTDHWDCMNRYATTASAEAEKRGRTAGLWTIVLHTLFSFLKSYFFKKGCLEGTRGLIQATLISSGVALKYAKLWERHNVTTHKPRQIGTEQKSDPE